MEGREGGREDTVTSVMIGTQLRHVRSFIIDGWLFSSLPLSHTCSPQWRVGFGRGGRGPGQIAARRQAGIFKFGRRVRSSAAQALEEAERMMLLVALLLDRRAAAVPINQISDT